MNQKDSVGPPGAEADLEGRAKEALDSKTAVQPDGGAQEAGRALEPAAQRTELGEDDVAGDGSA